MLMNMHTICEAVALTSNRGVAESAEHDAATAIANTRSQMVELSTIELVRTHARYTYVTNFVGEIKTSEYERN